MALEWSKTTEERACVKDAPEGSAIVSAGEGTIRVEADGEEGTSKKAAGPAFTVTSTEQLMALINTYLTEWQHRDRLFWKQAFAYFTSILAISALPFVRIWDVNSLPQEFPRYVFPIVGLVLSLLFITVMLAYTRRMECSRKSYTQLIDMLPPEYQLETVKRNPDDNSLVTKQMAKIIILVMFACLVLVGITSLIFSIKGGAYPCCKVN